MRRTALLVLVALASGCGAQPIDVPHPGEMRRGEPGLFTGPDGMGVIWGAPSEATQPEG